MSNEKLGTCDALNHTSCSHTKHKSCINWREQLIAIENCQRCAYCGSSVHSTQHCARQVGEQRAQAELPRTGLTDWENLRPDGTRHREPKLEISQAEIDAKVKAMQQLTEAVVDRHNPWRKVYEDHMMVCNRPIIMAKDTLAANAYFDEERAKLLAEVGELREERDAEGGKYGAPCQPASHPESGEPAEAEPRCEHGEIFRHCKICRNNERLGAKPLLIDGTAAGPVEGISAEQFRKAHPQLGFPYWTDAGVEAYAALKVREATAAVIEEQADAFECQRQEIDMMRAELAKLREELARAERYGKVEYGIEQELRKEIEELREERDALIKAKADERAMMNLELLEAQAGRSRAESALAEARNKVKEALLEPTHISLEQRVHELAALLALKEKQKNK